MFYITKEAFYIHPSVQFFYVLY